MTETFKVTLQSIVDALTPAKENGKPPLAKLGALDLPIKISWPFGETLAEAQKQNKRFTEARQSLFEKYGTQGENGFTVLSASVPGFVKDLNELLATEIDLPGKLIPLSVILAKESNELTGNDSAVLRPFVDSNS